MEIKITFNEFKSKNAVANVNVDFGNGLTLQFVELIKTKDGRQFLTHSSSRKINDSDEYKTTNHSRIANEMQEKLIKVIERAIVDSKQ